MDRLAEIAAEEHWLILDLSLLNYQLLGTMKPDGSHFDPGFSNASQDAWISKCIIGFYVDIRNVWDFLPFTMNQDLYVLMHKMPWMKAPLGNLKRLSSREWIKDPDILPRTFTLLPLQHRWCTSQVV